MTGSGQGIPKDLGALIGRVRAQTDLPLAVGFGITSAETVKEVAGVADAVVVGSAILNTVDKVDAAETPKVTCQPKNQHLNGRKRRWAEARLVLTSEGKQPSFWPNSLSAQNQHLNGMRESGQAQN